MPRIVDHDAWRAQALTRAFELFARRGFAAVSVRDVAEHLGVSTGKLYHYFPSKEALFEDMLRHLGHEDMLRVGRVMDGVPPARRADALVAFIGEHRAHFQSVVLMLLDYVRFHDGKRGDELPLLSWVAGFYRDAVTAQLGVAGSAAVPAFSVVLGMLLHEFVDPRHAPLELHASLLAAVASGKRDGAGAHEAARRA